MIKVSKKSQYGLRAMASFKRSVKSRRFGRSVNIDPIEMHKGVGPLGFKNGELFRVQYQPFYITLYFS